MQKKLLFKAILIVVLMLLLGVPLLMIESTISERMRFREEAANSIAADSVGEQRVVGPVLVMPYDEDYTVQEKVEGDDKKTETKRYRKRSQHLVFPGQLEVQSALATERRYRGIHQVLMYNGGHKVSGEFTVPPAEELPHTVARSEITPREPYIAVAVADVRGVRNIPRLAWGKRTVEFEQGSGLASERQVGLALAVFFLLLVSLSEHFPFLVAYIAASGACISLIAYYLMHVLHDWRRGTAFGAGLTLLYGALYGLLSSESNALMMGSLLLFAVLAALMVATRRIDWYQLGNVEGAENPA